jgi:hypothetical protein
MCRILRGTKNQAGILLAGLLLLSTTACVVQPELQNPEWLWLPMLITVPLAIVTALFGLLVLYYVLLVRAILEMLRLDANKVLLGFSFVSLIPAPPIVLMGVLILVIWNIHRRELLPEPGV